MKGIKKLFAAIIAVAMILACLPAIPAFAKTYDGTCGDNAYWSLDTETEVLTISGRGDMYNYRSTEGIPLYSHKLSIKAVNIENGVTSIGNNAFCSCSSLTSITIPDSVTSIGGVAFSGCSSLTSITIPDSVTSIGNSAFYGCSSLTSITIPDSVTSIGESAFYNTAYYNNEDNWKDNVLFIGNHLIKAKDSISGSYTIPAGTKTIAGGAFEDCSSLTSITIPDSVTSIGSYAFSNCDSLTSITIPDSVTSIGDSAFRDCSSLTSVTIGNGVTSIGPSAFYGCSNLTGITIPDSVTSIGNWAFGFCSKLTIKCYKDSAAYNYAAANSIPYIIIKKSASAPSAPTVEATTHNSVTLKNADGCEYSMDGENWQSSNVFSNLNPNKTYTFYQRVAETETTYASESSLGKEVTTDKVTVSTPSLPTVESKTHNSVTLTAIDGYEYKIDNGEWQSSNVFSNLKSETEYTFYQRIAETDTTCASEKSEAITVKTDARITLKEEGGIWYYTVDGEKVNATTLCYFADTWFYVENGKVNWSARTLCNYNGDWFFVENGMVNWNATTLCYFADTWFYVENGVLNWNARTLCNFAGTWFFVENGTVNWNATTLCYFADTWFYVENGILNWNARTLCNFANTWFFVENGTVNWNATTLCYFADTWFYVENGILNWNARTLCLFADTWFFVENGTVNWNAYTTCEYNGYNFNVAGGVVVF